MRGREALRQITPPVFMTAYRRVKKRPPTWEHLGPVWVEDDGPGWDSPGVVDAYVEKLPAFRAAVSSPAPIGVRTEALSEPTPNAYHQNVALEYAYAVARARGPRKGLSILDWGGGFGYMSLVVGELFPDDDVDFHV